MFYGRMKFWKVKLCVVTTILIFVYRYLNFLLKLTFLRNEIKKFNINCQFILKNRKKIIISKIHCMHCLIINYNRFIVYEMFKRFSSHF
jgi:hypothetical protein